MESLPSPIQFINEIPFIFSGIEETVNLVKSAGGICYGYVCDLCDREDIYKKAEQVKEEVGKVRIA